MTRADCEGLRTVGLACVTRLAGRDGFGPGVIIGYQQSAE